MLVLDQPATWDIMQSSHHTSLHQSFNQYLQAGIHTQGIQRYRSSFAHAVLLRQPSHMGHAMLQIELCMCSFAFGKHAPSDTEHANAAQMWAALWAHAAMELHTCKQKWQQPQLLGVCCSPPRVHTAQPVYSACQQRRDAHCGTLSFPCLTNLPSFYPPENVQNV